MALQPLYQAARLLCWEDVRWQHHPLIWLLVRQAATPGTSLHALQLTQSLDARVPDLRRINSIIPEIGMHP